MRNDAKEIIMDALENVMPGQAVEEALKNIHFKEGKLVLIAVGKASWEMAYHAYKALGNRIASGVVITKYGHSKGNIGDVEVFEAGHPVPDENSIVATQKVLEVVENLCEDDEVLLLLSGGGSALFEKPLISFKEMIDITNQLLACGADINEVNTIRKRISGVKGGRFAVSCMPAHVNTIVLSDIIGDPLDMIASGPAYPDKSTCYQALKIVKKYNLILSPEALKLLQIETPKKIGNVTTYVTGSVRQLCLSAEQTAKKLGYDPIFLTSSVSSEARELGKILGQIAKDHINDGHSLAYICGGETTVRLTGKGKGGRNQEIALSAAKEICGLKNICIFSFGSDGTDGPTDAAGGYVDGATAPKLSEKGYDIDEVLFNNDAYTALKEVDGLIMTGPTGTNVNDLSVVLIRNSNYSE